MKTWRRNWLRILVLIGAGTILSLLPFSDLQSGKEKNSSSPKSGHEPRHTKSSITLYLTDEDRKLRLMSENDLLGHCDVFHSDGLAYTWDGYFLDGDISGNQYAIVLYFEAGVGPVQLKAEILVNNDVVAQKSFTCTDCLLPTAMAFTFSGSNPSTKAGDEVSLKVTKESGQVIAILWGTTTEKSSIVLPAVTTAVDLKDSETLPESPFLHQNYPNPFNAGTILLYQIHIASSVLLEIYSLRGQLVKTLVHQEQAPGIYSATWEGNDESGRPAPSGFYFYRLRTKGFEATKKAALLR